LHQTKCELGSIAFAFNDRTWLEAAQRKRHKFINKLRKPIIILSNSATGVELINHKKDRHGGERKREREREREREGKFIVFW